jgi:hypothetical protein
MKEFGNWQSGAVFDLDNWHRFELWRRWERHGRMVTFIGLNPSTATHEDTDATVTRWTRFAQRWGYGGFYAVNLYSYRHPKPDGLRRAAAVRGWEDVEQGGLFLRPGPAERFTAHGIPTRPNDLRVFAAVRASALVVGCWGALRWPEMRRRVVEVLELVQSFVPVHAVAVTKDGQPGHVLRKRADLVPALWVPPAGLGLGEQRGSDMTEQSGSTSNASDAGTAPIIR